MTEFKMFHNPSTVRLASLHFGGYLNKEELQESQYEGRLWDLLHCGDKYRLIIILDDETVLFVDEDASRGITNEAIEYIGNALSVLPSALHAAMAVYFTN